MVIRTLLMLTFLASCVVGEAPLETEDAPDAPDPNVALGPPLTWPIVRSGDSNQMVVTVQYLLRQAGFVVALDGSFRAETEAAVRNFQSLHGLATDGVIGPGSWPRLIVSVARGDQNAAVSAAQYLLENRHGKSLDVTGLFGATTELAVKEIQAERCLAATGVIGLYTWNALVADRSFCSGGGSGLASRLLASHQAGTITLWDQTFGRNDGADPLSNIRDAAAGRAARTSCYGNATCTTVALSPSLLGGMDRMRTQYNFSFFVTAIAGASHATGSYHFSGRAFDVDEVNGVRISGDSPIARQWMMACAALGAIEVLGPSNDSSHQDHVHCAW